MNSNPYDILDLDRSATDEEVKDAYREKAKEHHPDRGGDAEKFKEIQKAKQEILDGSSYESGFDSDFSFDDVGGGFGPNGFEGSTGDKTVEEMFEDFAEFASKGGFERRGFQGSPFGDQYSGSKPKLQVFIPFDVAVLGGEIEVRGYEFGQEKIDVPPGVKNGTTLDYGRNKTVEFNVENGTDFWRKNDNDLYTKREISVWDAMTGKDGIEVDTLQGKTVRFSVPPGTKDGAQFRLEGWGGPKTFNNIPEGDMYVEVSLNIPEVVDEEKKDLIEQIRDES